MMSGAQQRRHDVVQVTAYYSPHLGGLENVAQTLSELLAERHNVLVMTTTCGSGNAPVREEKAGVQVRRFSGFAVAHTPLSLGLALGLLVVGRRSIVHVHSAHAFVPEVVLVTSTLRRRPYIAHFHLDVDPSGPFGVLLSSYKRWILGPFLRRAAAVIALSDEQAAFLESHYGVHRDRITVIPNGVHPAFYRLPPSGGEESIAEPRVLRLLFVGRLDAQKNVPRLVDAMTHVSSDVELVIVGDGELRDVIARRIDQLGLTCVRLAGAARGADLVRWYRWADAFVLPSDKEGMPLVILEAMAAGLAIVATDAPGTREIVEGVGLLTQPNPESLGAAIERVAADPDLLSKLSVRSAARGRKFRWDASVIELERLYDLVAIE
jgi:glycosyltransferase involved in cell wall biosynthesis